MPGIKEFVKKAIDLIPLQNIILMESRPEILKLLGFPRNDDLLKER